jgi:hypothetical protein
MKSYENIINKTSEIMNYLKNDDGGWGEFKTQSSRVTNTCEAIWCLVELGEDINKKHKNSIELIRNSVSDTSYNVCDYKKCEIGRDYGWVIIALSCYDYKSNSDIIDKAIDKLEILQSDDGGFKQRDSNDTCPFNSSIVLIGLLFTYHNSNRENSKSIDIAKKIITYLDKYLECASYIGGELSYAIYALSLCYSLNIFHIQTSKNKIEEIAKKIDINKMEYENKSRDIIGKVRPYRHYSLVWILLALNEIKSNDRIDFAYKLVNNFSEKKGWNVPDIDYGLTWGNAISFTSFNKFHKSVSPLDFLYKQYLIGNKMNKKNVFIVHGHGEKELLELEKHLKNEFDLTPVIVKDHASISGTESLISKIIRLMDSCYSAIVLLTPDDEIKKDDITYMQARPNVLFELGMCMEKYNGRVVFLRKNGCKLFSDIDGLIRIDFNDIDGAHIQLKRQFSQYNII